MDYLDDLGLSEPEVTYTPDWSVGNFGRGKSTGSSLTYFLRDRVDSLRRCSYKIPPDIEVDYNHIEQRMMAWADEDPEAQASPEVQKAAADLLLNTKGRNRHERRANAARARRTV